MFQPTCHKVAVREPVVAATDRLDIGQRSYLIDDKVYIGGQNLSRRAFRTMANNFRPHFRRFERHRRRGSTVPVVCHPGVQRRSR